MAETQALFGTHNGITCDGCGTKPIIGFRYKCQNCANHDYCEACYEEWKKGKVPAWSARVNPVSPKAEDHKFVAYADKNGDFQSSIKGAGAAKPAEKKAKVKPNDPCPCGSGKKAKKCGCGAYVA